MAGQFNENDNDKSGNIYSSSSRPLQHRTDSTDEEVIIASVEFTRQLNDTTKKPEEHLKVNQETKFHENQVHKCCPDGFCDMIGQRKARNEQLCQRELELRQRLTTLECWMPTVTLLKIMTGGLDPSNICDVIGEQAATMSLSHVQPRATLSQHKDSRVRDVDAERKAAQRKLEEARILLREKQLAIEERAKQIEEAKRKRKELERRLEELDEKVGSNGIDLKKNDSTESIGSFGPDDLNYLIKLEESVKAEKCKKRQLEELERREQAYIKTLQAAEKIMPKNDYQELDKLRGKLEVKSSANIELAGRICELEDQVENLKKKLANCRENVIQLTEEQIIDGVKLNDKQKTEFAVVNDRKIKTQDNNKIARPGLVPSTSGALKTSEKGISAVVRTASKETLSRTELTDRAVQELTHLPIIPQHSRANTKTQYINTDTLETSVEELNLTGAEDHWDENKIMSDKPPRHPRAGTDKSHGAAADQTATSNASTDGTVSLSEVEKTGAGAPQDTAKERGQRVVIREDQNTIDTQAGRAHVDDGFVSLKSQEDPEHSDWDPVPSLDEQNASADKSQAGRRQTVNDDGFKTLLTSVGPEVSDWTPSGLDDHVETPKSPIQVQKDPTKASQKTVPHDLTYVAAGPDKPGRGPQVDAVMIPVTDIEGWIRNAEAIRRTITKCGHCNSRVDLIEQLCTAWCKRLGIPYAPFDMIDEDAGQQRRRDDRTRGGVIRVISPIAQSGPSPRDHLEQTLAGKHGPRGTASSTMKPEYDSRAGQLSDKGIDYLSNITTMGDSQWPRVEQFYATKDQGNIVSMRPTLDISQWLPVPTLDTISEGDDDPQDPALTIDSPMAPPKHTSTPKRHKQDDRRARIGSPPPYRQESTLDDLSSESPVDTSGRNITYTIGPDTSIVGETLSPDSDDNVKTRSHGDTLPHQLPASPPTGTSTPKRRKLPSDATASQEEPQLDPDTYTKSPRSIKHVGKPVETTFTKLDATRQDTPAQRRQRHSQRTDRSGDRATTRERTYTLSDRQSPSSRRPDTQRDNDTTDLSTSEDREVFDETEYPSLPRPSRRKRQDDTQRTDHSASREREFSDETEYPSFRRPQRSPATPNDTHELNDETAYAEIRRRSPSTRRYGRADRSASREHDTFETTYTPVMRDGPDQSVPMQLDTMPHGEVSITRGDDSSPGIIVSFPRRPASRRGEITTQPDISVPTLPDANDDEDISSEIVEHEKSGVSKESKRMPRGREDERWKIDEKRKNERLMKTERRGEIKDRQEKGSQVYSGRMTGHDERKSSRRKKNIADNEIKLPDSHTQDVNKCNVAKLSCCICHASRRFHLPLKMTRTEYERCSPSEIKTREYKNKNGSAVISRTVDTQTRVRRHEVTVRHNLADFSCDECDCDPCGTDPGRPKKNESAPT